MKILVLCQILLEGIGPISLEIHGVREHEPRTAELGGVQDQVLD